MTDIFECGVCFERFNSKAKRPKVLPCGHTYCLSCLRNHEGSKGCPTCRKVFEGYADKLPDNYSLFPRMEDKGDAPMSFYCSECQCEALDRCLKEHNIRNMSAVVLEKVKEAKNTSQKDFQKEENLLKEFSKMLQSTQESVEKTLLTRLKKEYEEFESRVKEVQKFRKIIDDVPMSVFENNSSISELIESFSFENNLRLYFFEEQKRMLEIAKKCTLTVTSDDSKVSWDIKLAANKKSAPEEKVLSYLLYVMLVNQSQNREAVSQQPPSTPAVPSGAKRLPGGATAAPAPGASSASAASSNTGIWQRASWAATPWPETTNNTSRLEELVEKATRCVKEGLSLSEEDDSDSDGFSVISETTSIPDQCSASNRLFVDGLPHSVTSDDIRAVFSKCGSVKYVRILDSKKRKRKQFNCALVYFPDDATVERVLRNRPFELLQCGKDWNSRVRLKVTPDRTSRTRTHKKAFGRIKSKDSAGVGDSDDSQKIYVTNVPINVLEPDLQRLFSQFGTVISVNMRTHGVGKNNYGFAFVTFTNRESAQRALNKKPIIINGAELSVREFKSKIIKNKHSNQEEKGRKQESFGPRVTPVAGTMTHPLTQNEMKAIAANAASLQLQANAASMQVAAAALSHSNGIYPSLLSHTKGTQGGAAYPKPSAPPAHITTVNSNVGMSYDEVYGSISGREQLPKIQPKGKKAGKGEDNCSIM